VTRTTKQHNQHLKTYKPTYKPKKKKKKKKGGKTQHTNTPRSKPYFLFSLTDFVEQLKTPTAQTLETKWLAQNHYREDYQKKRRTKKNSDNIKKKTKKTAATQN